jgi:hypothetical protein
LQVLAESKWLREFPQSRAWDALHGRIAHYQSEEGMLAKAAEKEMAERFIDTAELQGAEHVNNLLNGADNEKERLVVRMTFALLDDAVSELIAEIGREALGNAKIAWNVLNKSLIKSVASVSLGLEGNGSRYGQYAHPPFLPFCCMYHACSHACSCPHSYDLLLCDADTGRCLGASTCCAASWQTRSGMRAQKPPIIVKQTVRSIRQKKTWWRRRCRYWMPLRWRRLRTCPRRMRSWCRCRTPCRTQMRTR